jgi:hypothetical protein
MKQPPEHSKPSFDRRRFISNTIKLAMLAGIVSPIEQACNNKSSQKPGTTDTANTKKKSTTHTAKHTSTRKKWNQEKLVMNSKTNVVHLPTSVVYVYYDEIKHIQDMNMTNWESQVQGKVHLNKDQSGNILEILSLQKLRSEVNDDSLNNAINILSKAFGKECENSRGINHNTTNYRLHELMLQLVALNSNIPATGKWNTFNEKVKKPQKIGKRQKWMETEISFNERIKYIQEREADYKKRLSQRASKYSFT